MNNLHYIFIINPKSGTGKQAGIENIIREKAENKNIQYEIVFTQYAGHAGEIAKKGVAEKKYAVVVVGGDGSVNETAKALLHSETLLGIIPTGSGNGLARHLGISMSLPKAVEQIFSTRSKKMDVGILNEHLFLSTAGLGFDAKVAHQFAKQKKRGFSTYIKTTRKELFAYKPQSFIINNENDTLETKAFMLSIANIPQFGNNFIVNPFANEEDGLLNCTIITPFSKIKIPVMLNKFFKGKINTSKHFSQLTGKEFTLESNETYAHVDGEPIVLMEGKITASVIEKALTVIIP